MRTQVFACAVLVLVIGLCGCGPKEEVQDPGPAIKAAEAWLALVDAGDYGESWEQASAHFQKVVSKKQWVEALTAHREPLGTLKERQVDTAKFQSNLEGAPDGEYVVIQFEASFDKKAKGIETVTPVHGEAGVWKVSGYYIR